MAGSSVKRARATGPRPGRRRRIAAGRRSGFGRHQPCMMPGDRPVRHPRRPGPSILGPQCGQNCLDRGPRSHRALTWPGSRRAGSRRPTTGASSGRSPAGERGARVTSQRSPRRQRRRRSSRREPRCLSPRQPTRRLQPPPPTVTIGGTACRQRSDRGCRRTTVRFQRPYSKYCVASALQRSTGAVRDGQLRDRTRPRRRHRAGGC